MKVGIIMGKLVCIGGGEIPRIKNGIWIFSRNKRNI